MNSEEPDIYALLKAYRDLQGGLEFYGYIYTSIGTRDVMDIVERYWRERIAKETAIQGVRAALSGTAIEEGGTE